MNEWKIKLIKIGNLLLDANLKKNVSPLIKSKENEKILWLNIILILYFIW